MLHDTLLTRLSLDVSHAIQGNGIYFLLILFLEIRLSKEWEAHLAVKILTTIHNHNNSNFENSV